MSEDLIRKEILEKVKQYYQAADKKKFIPGVSYIPYAGRVYDEDELISLVDSSLDFTQTAGSLKAIRERYGQFPASSIVRSRIPGLPPTSWQ